MIDVTTNGDFEVAFNLKRPQPALLALLASGYTPVYPCHVSPGDMRTKPIGTGPFKFVEFKANESIKLIRNPDYWKKGLPHLDGIEFTIIPNRSTRYSGVRRRQVRHDVSDRGHRSRCSRTSRRRRRTRYAWSSRSTSAPTSSSTRPRRRLTISDIRRAMALALDRKAFVSILFEGQADIGGTMLPAPGGLWAMPKEMLETIPGYGPDVKANREEARKLMQKAGYGPDKHLQVKVSTRNIPVYRDPPLS